MPDRNIILVGGAKQTSREEELSQPTGQLIRASQADSGAELASRARSRIIEESGRDVSANSPLAPA